MVLKENLIVRNLKKMTGVHGHKLCEDKW